MKILVNRTNTENKGAELMLYAILQELEKKHPDATVVLPYTGFAEGSTYIETPIKVVFRQGKWLYDLLNKTYALRVLRKLGMELTYFTDMYPVSGIDYLIDAGGFQFSDQIGYRINTPARWEFMLKKYKKQGTKIIFLPQAFGPFKKEEGKELIHTIAKHSDLIFAREEVSLNYLKECGIGMDNIRLAPDFTLPMHGKFPERYNNLRDGVAIIPNMRMVDKGVVSYDIYLNVMGQIVEKCNGSGHKAFLLNHEGKGDETICKKIAASLGNKIEVVSGLNAIEVKGIIGGCYAVISSRFHGVASSLSQSIPVLATSWSHKYELLFKDFGVSDSLIDVNDGSAISQLSSILDADRNADYRKLLDNSRQTVAKKIEEMWAEVWEA